MERHIPYLPALRIEFLIHSPYTFQRTPFHSIINGSLDSALECRMGSSRELILCGLVIAFSLAGLADALYFTFAYYGHIKKARWVPKTLCAAKGSTCVTVVQTPYARVFGIPNSLLGSFYYVLLIGWAAIGPSRVSPGLTWLLIAGSFGSVATGLYLIYALRRKLHIDCPMCYAAHAINTTLFVLLILLAW
jgi:uncharacterized membrane protein